MSVIFITLILSSTVVVGYWAVPPFLEQNKASETVMKLESLAVAVRRYREHNMGSNPPALANLASRGTLPACTMDTDPGSPTYQKFLGWCGPYLESQFVQDPTAFLRDGWGADFRLESDRVRSCGNNNVCGDQDDVTVQL